MGRRQPDFLERAGEAESVYQPEQERQDGGKPSRERFSLTDRLVGDEDDRERNAGFDRRRTQCEYPEGCAGERETMRGRKRGDGPNELTPEADEEQEPENECQMIVASENVFDTQHRVSLGDFTDAALVICRAVQPYSRCVSREGINACLPIEPVDLDHDRGVALANAADCQRPSEAIGSTVNQPFLGAARF